MLSTLNGVLARARHAEMVDRATRHRGPRGPAPRDGGRRWQGVTVRQATSADGSALARLAELDEARPLRAPALLGVVMARPVAALSLADGRVLADPFTPTADLVELLRLRARQLAHAPA